MSILAQKLKQAMEPCTLDVDGERLLTRCRVSSRILREWTDVSRLASRTMSLRVWKVESGMSSEAEGAAV